MGKTPKKAGPGGDERILYVRRLKATSTLSSKGSDTNLPVRQRESDNSNRPKPIAVNKRLPVPVGKAFKPTTSKEEKKPTPAVTPKSQDTEESRMYTETEESAVQLKVSITKKDVKEGSAKTVEETHKVEEETSVSHSHSNGKESAGSTEVEKNTSQEEDSKERNGETSPETGTNEETSKPENHENGNECSEKTKKNSEKEEAEPATSESEESSLKLVDEPEAEKSPEQNGNSEEISNRKTEENGERKEEKRAESCSVDVVESTTSEPVENADPTQSEKDVETADQPKENDPSFVSYDSSIMLKDVQIKLNDCLKDNSKLFDVSNAEESTSEEMSKRADVSFGKTLRNISGRATINRLKYVTVREQRFSPNSSLFVNTSSSTLNLDDSTSGKITRYPTDLSDSIICNGTPSERKRKMPDSTGASAKKSKTESSILNTSLEMLKNLTRPVQVSTPNAKPYKFQTNKLSPKSLGDDNLTIDPEVNEPKKWCIVM